MCYMNCVIVLCFPTLYSAFFHHQCVYQSVDHHWQSDVFVTSGQTVEVWDERRTEPVRSFAWGVDSVHHVKFNPVEVTES